MTMIHLPRYDVHDARTLRVHLSLVHGIYTNDVKKAQELVECHDADHVEHFGAREIRHTHDQDQPNTLVMWEF
jgi:hypothetical protein